MPFKIVYSNTKDEKSEARQSQVCYLRTNHSSVLKESVFGSCKQRNLQRLENKTTQLDFSGI